MRLMTRSRSKLSSLPKCVRSQNPPLASRYYKFVPATVLSQGQVVYYTVRITNPAPVPASRVVVTQRIPANTTYVAGSAAGPGADVTFSGDGGVTFAPAEQLTTIVDGKARPLPPLAAHSHPLAIA